MADKLKEVQSNDFFLEFNKKIHAEKIETDGKHSSDIGMNSYTKQPYSGTSYTRRGVWDLTNPFQFAPYESGYCMLAVLSSPAMFNTTTTVTSKDNNGKDVKTKVKTYNNLLQKAFVRMLENEFKGLDGLEDITADTMEFSDGITTTSRISKVNYPLQQNISMRYTEKTGSLITKYLSTYLKNVKDPRSQVKIYDTDPRKVGFNKEVFNMLYIITDSTCLRVEKAFLLVNAFPTSAPYSDMYNMERGSIESKEITINFSANVIDGEEANRIAYAYIKTLVNLTSTSQGGKINLNSSNYDYSFSDKNGNRRKISTIKVRNFEYDSKGNIKKYSNGDPKRVNEQIELK